MPINPDGASGFIYALLKSETFKTDVFETAAEIAAHKRGKTDTVASKGVIKILTDAGMDSATAQRKVSSMIAVSHACRKANVATSGHQSLALALFKYVLITGGAVDGGNVKALEEKYTANNVVDFKAVATALLPVKESKSSTPDDKADTFLKVLVKPGTTITDDRCDAIMRACQAIKDRNTVNSIYV